jgi:hypothetical protein
MAAHDDNFLVRPGRIGHGNRGVRRPKSFAAEVRRAAKKAGGIPAEPSDRAAGSTPARHSGEAGVPHCFCRRAPRDGGLSSWRGLSGTTEGGSDRLCSRSMLPI